MTPAELLEHVRALGAETRVREGKLQIRDPAGAVPDELRVELRRTRHEVADLVSQQENLDRRIRTLRWVPIRSRLLNDTFVLALDPAWLEAARAAHAGRVVYDLEEALDLCDRRAQPATLRLIHDLKRRFGGRCAPRSEEDQERAEPMLG